MIARTAPTTRRTPPQQCHRCGGYSSTVLSHPSGLCGDCATPQPRRPALIVVMYRRGLWRVNLTNHLDVWGTRQHHAAGAALTHVHSLLRGGHRLAFQSAYIDLVVAAVAELGQPPAA